MRQRFSLALVLVILGVSTLVQSQGSIESASTILKQLVQDSENKLKDHKQYWNENEPLLRSAAEQVEQQRQTQQRECDTLQDILSGTESELAQTNHYIEWISTKIVDNERKIGELEENRCSQSRLYVESLKHNKIALSLIDFMKTAINQKEDLSLIQRKKIVSNLEIFVQMYTDNRIKDMIKNSLKQDYEVETSTDQARRTADEIGDKHIDQQRDDLELRDYESSSRQSWPEYKANLLALLDDLETQIKNQMERAQEDEVNSGVSLAEFKIQVERENQQLAKHLTEQQARAEELEVQITEESSQVDTCNQQLSIVSEQSEQAALQYEEERLAFETRKEAIIEEIGTLNYVLRMYTDSIRHDEGAYEDRLDDYLTDGSFDTTYSSREMDKFERIGGSSNYV